MAHDNPQRSPSERDARIKALKRSLAQIEAVEAEAAVSAAANDSLLAFAFGTLGLLTGLVLALFAVAGLSDWPKWLRFVTVIMSAGATSYVFARLAPLLFVLLSGAVAAAVLALVGILVWAIV